MSFVEIGALVATLILVALALSRGVTRDEDGDHRVDPEKVLKHGWVFLVLIVVVWGVSMSIHTVPPGHRGVQLLFGSVQPIVMQEGLNFKAPWMSVVDMKVMLEIEEVEESTASKDLQEVTTKLAVHFNVLPDMANEVYQNMRQSYHSLLLIPVIQEDLKATTATFTAEQLITQRELVVSQLLANLRDSLTPYGINVQTVNIVNFAFSPSFSAAIESKVTAEQDALRERNVLEKIKWEQQQNIAVKEAAALMQIIQARADANQTVINAEAAARQKVIAAEAEAQRILLEAQAQADAIMLVATQLTPEYTQYLYLLEWNGVLPGIVAGDGMGLLLNYTTK